MHVAVRCSGTYKAYAETTEHIELDLQKFRDVTKELTYHMNKVCYLFSYLAYDWLIADIAIQAGR